MLFEILFAVFHILIIIHLKMIEETLISLLYFNDILLAYIECFARINKESSVQFYLIIIKRFFQSACYY